MNMTERERDEMESEKGWMEGGRTERRRGDMKI